MLPPSSLVAASKPAQNTQFKPAGKDLHSMPKAKATLRGPKQGPRKAKAASKEAKRTLKLGETAGRKAAKPKAAKKQHLIVAEQARAAALPGRTAQGNVLANAARISVNALTPMLLLWAQAAHKAPTEELSKHSKASSATEVAHAPPPGPSDKPAAGVGSGWAARVGDNLEELFRQAKSSAAGVLHRVWAPRAWAPRAT